MKYVTNVIVSACIFFSNIVDNLFFKMSSCFVSLKLNFVSTFLGSRNKATVGRKDKDVIALIKSCKELLIKPGMLSMQT